MGKWLRALVRTGFFPTPKFSGDPVLVTRISLP